MQKHNPDTKHVPGQANELHRGNPKVSSAAKTVFGSYVSDDDELARPPHDRSPLTSLFQRPKR